MKHRHADQGQQLLVVSAHPDDAEFTSGGSIARWGAEGWTVHLVVCTDGGRGSHDPAVDPARLAARRHEFEQILYCNLTC